MVLPDETRGQILKGQKKKKKKKTVRNRDIRDVTTEPQPNAHYLSCQCRYSTAVVVPR